MMSQTRREEILQILQSGPWTATGLAAHFGVKLKIIEDDLQHIIKSAGGKFRLCITEATCPRCDFVFRSRKKLTKPSRCPKCKNERVEEPMLQLFAR